MFGPTSARVRLRTASAPTPKGRSGTPAFPASAAPESAKAARSWTPSWPTAAASRACSAATTAARCTSWPTTTATAAPRTVSSWSTRSPYGTPGDPDKPHHRRDATHRPRTPGRRQPPAPVVSVGRNSPTTKPPANFAPTVARLQPGRGHPCHTRAAPSCYTGRASCSAARSGHMDVLGTRPERLDLLAVDADEVQRPTRSAVVEFVGERLRRDRPEGVFDDAGDLVPIDAVVAIGVEVDAEPSGDHARRRGGRMEEPVWFAGRQVGGHARRGGAPQRDAAVAAVVVVEVAQRPLALHEEARLAVADALSDARQGQCDPAHLVELVAFHLSSVYTRPVVDTPGRIRRVRTTQRAQRRRRLFRDARDAGRSIRQRSVRPGTRAIRYGDRLPEWPSAPTGTLRTRTALAARSGVSRGVVSGRWWPWCSLRGARRRQG